MNETRFWVCVNIFRVDVIIFCREFIKIAIPKWQKINFGVTDVIYLLQMVHFGSLCIK